MSTVYKAPVNYRGTPVRVLAPEAFQISGGFAMLAEAPADPALYPPTILVGGNPRTRVDVPPVPGQYRILTQGIVGIGIEYLPILQFHASDEGLTGTADYYGTGTIITTQFFSMLQAFLTPLLGYTDVGALPAPTMNQTQRGRPGDIAFFADGTGYFSDGTQWNIFMVSSGVRGSLSLIEAMLLALDAGYVGPSFVVSIPAFVSSYVFSQDGIFLPPGFGDLTLASVLGLSEDAVAAAGDVGDITITQALGMTMDSVLGLLASMPSFAATFVSSLDATFGGAPSYVTASDDFQRANGALGSNWLTAYGRSAFTISGNFANPPASGAHGNYWNATFTSDHYSEAQVAWATQSGPNVSAINGTCVAVRMQPSADSFYCAAIYATASTRYVMLGKVINGVFTNLAEVAAGIGEFLVRLEVWGSTLLVKTGAGSPPHGHFTTRIMFTDTSLTGGAPGFIADGAAAHSSGVIDLWYGGDMTEWYDTFQYRANGPLGFNWALLTGSAWEANYPAIVNNGAVVWNASPYAGAAYLSSPSFPPDQYAETHQTAQLAGPLSGPAVRLGASQGYIAACVPSGDDGKGGPANWTITLYRWNGTSLTSLASDSTAPLSESIAKITAQGNTIKVYSTSVHGGTYNLRVTVTDNTYLSGGAPGFYAQANVNSGSGVDSFYGGIV